MNIITQDIKFKQSVIKYSQKNGLTAASLVYKAPSKKKVYEPKAYQQMTYPGQRVQVDAKYVPMRCLTNLQKFLKRKKGIS